MTEQTLCIYVNVLVSVTISSTRKRQIKHKQFDLTHNLSAQGIQVKGDVLMSVNLPVNSTILGLSNNHL